MQQLRLSVLVTGAGFLLRQVRLEPKDGVLWAHPTPKTNGLSEVSPLPLKVVAGASCRRYQALVTALDILSSGPRSKTVKAPPSVP